MMTKEEFIENAIECRKEGCDEVFRDQMCEISCEECPMNHSTRGWGYCSVDDYLLDEIIRLREEKAERIETNLEHYTKETGLVVLERKDYMEVTFMLPKETKTALEYQGAWNWLLSPYEPPKKYQMTQLCYDVVKRYVDKRDEESELDKNLEHTSLFDMLTFLDFYDKAWFGITIRELYENVEVVEE